MNKQNADALCLCHCIEAGKDEELRNFTEKSWGTFRLSAEVRKDNIYERMSEKWDAKNIEEIGRYHRKCYQHYTNKTNLDRLKRKREISGNNASSYVDSQTQDLPHPKRLSRSAVSATTYDACILCQTNKYSKRFKDNEPLTNLETIQASETLVEAARKRNDERILLAVEGRDLVAMEVKYHRTCYKGYTHKRDTQDKETTFEEVFKDFTTNVQRDIVEGQKVCFMTELLEEFRELAEQHCIAAESYTSQKLKSKLQKHFDENLQFWHPVNRSQSEIVFSNNVLKGQLVESQISDQKEVVFNTSKQRADSLNDNIDMNLCHSSSYIHKLLKSAKVNLQWPPVSQDLSEESVTISPEIFNFLAAVMYGSEIVCYQKKVILSEKNARIVMSIAQDMIYASSNGRTKPPKHLSLSMAVKNISGSKQVVELLNRFGHGLSNTQLDAMETAIAIQQQSIIDIAGVYVPRNVQAYPNIIVQMCYDNNHILEETLSG